MSFEGIPFRSYRIEASSDLKGWSVVESGIVAGVGPTHRTLDGAALGFPARFFRVVEEGGGAP